MRTRYHAALRLLHWSMAVLILAMLAIGAGMTSTAGPAYAWLVALHRPLGLALLGLVLIRLALRLRTGAPALPSDMPRIMSAVAHLTHVLFYGVMIGLPLIGWAMLSAGGYPVQIAPGFHLPPLIPQDLHAFGLLRLTHGVLAYLFFVLVLGHVGAALFHALIRQDGVFKTMSLGGSGVAEAAVSAPPLEPTTTDAVSELGQAAAATPPERGDVSAACESRRADGSPEKDQARSSEGQGSPAHRDIRS